MSTSIVDAKIDNWESYILETDLEPDSEKRCISENNERLLDDKHFDLNLEADLGDCLNFDNGSQKEQLKPESQREKNSEAEKNGYKSESEKGDFKTESEESDPESEKIPVCSDLYDRLIDLQITGCGDGITDSSIPAYDDQFNHNVTARRGRSLHDSVSAFKEPIMEQFPLRSRKDDGTDFCKENLLYDTIPESKMAAGSTFAKSTTSCADWYKYVTPKMMCLIILSIIYLGFTIFGIKILNSSANSP